LERRWALATLPKRQSWQGSNIFKPSAKLTNQLEEGELEIALIPISIIKIGVKPKALVTTVPMIIASTRTRV
jgi:hypothetical protein